MSPTKVAILWHMHQPFYEDLASGEHILPWVRLHALKDYFGMVALLREFPKVKVTFNLVPSLLVQLEAFAQGQARDRYLDLSLKPASDLTAGDIEFIQANFFHANRRRMIDIYPRYAELASKRGRRFTEAEIRDLQVWQKLAWVDPVYLDTDPRIVALLAKGREFTEQDKATLREVELELLNRIIPEYAGAAKRGQVELSASPFYHPILPLLCDTDIYSKTNPDAGRPRVRFAYPADAREQLERAAACHERLFGDRPTGLWPSEGSVSDEIVPLVAAAGFRWMATDELVLARTLGIAFSRDGYGRLEQPERLYAAYNVRVGTASVACAFRDHVLSDLIGFTYADGPADRAADDLVTRLVEAGRRFAERTGGEVALIPIILDGENAWENYEGGGRPFLRALYSRLSDHPELRTVTMSEGCEVTTREIAGIFPGSWIDASFSIWIGHADDQRAWSQLAEARAALDTAGPEAPDLATAREEILIGEGSDWCWWYGDDHSSAQDLEFDDLFRRHLKNAYRMMGRESPSELFVSNISSREVAPPIAQPTRLLSPTIDGVETSYFEWLGAGIFEAGTTEGTMHRAERRTRLVGSVRFGFDRERFYVRIDAPAPDSDAGPADAPVASTLREALETGHQISLEFAAPASLRVSVRKEAGRVFARTVGVNRESPVPDRDVAADRVVEMALSRSGLQAQPGSQLAFFVTVTAPDGAELERQPGFGPIEVLVPDALFEARMWQA